MTYRSSARIEPVISPQTVINPCVESGRGGLHRGVVASSLSRPSIAKQVNLLSEDNLDCLEVMPVEDDEVEGILEAEEEAPIAKKLPTPAMPTQSDYESHRECGHIPYRAWCKHCVEGRGREFGHHRSSGIEKQVSTVAFDYMFITDKGVFMRNELPADFEVDPLLVAHDLDGGDGISPAEQTG